MSLQGTTDQDQLVRAEDRLLSIQRPKFDLRLANGRQWQLVGTEGTEAWLENLASLMQLNPSQDAGVGKARIVFALMGPKRVRTISSLSRKWEVDDLGLPQTGWRSRNMRGIRIRSHPQVEDVLCEIRPPVTREISIASMWLALDPIYRRAIELGGLPLHAGMLEKAGEAFILVAPGATGKSTCCRRPPSPWGSPCDDEVLVVVDNQGQFLAHPFPTWSDHLWGASPKTWVVEESYPVKGIFFLKRSDRDLALPVGQAEAAMLISGSAHQVLAKSVRGLSRYERKLLKKQVFDNACSLSKQIPAFVLQFTLTGEFWRQMDDAIASSETTTACKTWNVSNAFVRRASGSARSGPFSNGL